ncbi:MAG: ABC transporter ATP-binding protein [Bacteroidota bacterium]
MDQDILIKMDSVYKYHYTNSLETAALNGIDLTINRGEFVSIMGPSGSGKSTLLNVMGMIDKMDKGSFLFENNEINGLSQKERTAIRKGTMGFIFQSFNLIDGLTTFENVELPLLYLKISKKDRKKRIEKALESLEMMHRRDHYPQQLSGGQQQRVAIARATVVRPKLILADEPTGNLDSKNSLAVMNILKELHNTGSSIVMVTHSLEDASYAERTIQLFDGNVLMDQNQHKKAV